LWIESLFRYHYFQHWGLDGDFKEIRECISTSNPTLHLVWFAFRPLAILLLNSFAWFFISARTLTLGHSFRPHSILSVSLHGPKNRHLRWASKASSAPFLFANANQLADFNFDGKWITVNGEVKSIHRKTAFDYRNNGCKY